MKALILYTNTGAGHVSAGRAIHKSFASIGVDCIELDSLDFAGKNTSRRVAKSYTTIVKKSPELFGLIYKAGVKISRPNKKSVVYGINSLYAKRLYTILKDEKPDIIVCTHVFCAQTITYLERKYKFSAVSACVVTDYTCAPFWEETDQDYYFIPHKDLEYEFVVSGIDKNKLVSLGLPVDPKFSQHIDKRASKEELGYDPNLQHVVVMGGSMGAGDILETTTNLVKELPNVQFSVICGSNEKLYNKFINANLNKNIKIIQYANNMDKIMNSTDIMISKPGGLTSTEAMVKRIPLIMINPIPGVESANCEFFKEHNMAVQSKDAEETTRLCKLLIEDKELYNSIVNSQTKNINQNSSDDIAKFLLNKANNMKNK